MVTIPHSILTLLQQGNRNLPIIRIVPRGETLGLERFDGLTNYPLLIADEASLAAAKPYLSMDLLEKLLPTSLTFPAPAKPEMDGFIKGVLSKAKESNAEEIIVIGSGSLSDIGKYVAAELSLPLTIVATAPSMNGYSSVTASLLDSGMKQSFSAKMPDVIIVSEDIIGSAPKWMQRAGLADSLASISADLDWQLSHHLLGTPYFPECIEAQMPLFEKAADDPMALMELLLIQGMCMSATGTSAPASGGEHMLAHLLEMLRPDLCVNLLHGELIAITHPIYLQYQLDLINSGAELTIREFPEERELTDMFKDKLGNLEKQMDDKQDIIKKISSGDTPIGMPIKNIIGHENVSRLEKINDLVGQLNLSESKELQKLARELLPYAFISRGRLTMLDLKTQQQPCVI